VNLSPPAPSTPSIGRGMLTEPPGRPLDGVATAQTPATTLTTGRAASNPVPTNIFSQAAQSPLTNPAGAPKQQATSAATGNAAPSGGRDNTVAVLVAWVLLSGSAAGNLYLFWSYLDVRQKYRAMVRKTARAVGNRFSPA
jgi:hypothetical protein